MKDPKSVLVSDLLNHYSNGEAFNMDAVDLRFVESTPAGLVLGLYDEDENLKQRFLVTVQELNEG